MAYSAGRRKILPSASVPPGLLPEYMAAPADGASRIDTKPGLENLPTNQFSYPNLTEFLVGRFPPNPCQKIFVSPPEPKELLLFILMMRQAAEAFQ
jgi:hypothetical protein